MPLVVTAPRSELAQALQRRLDSGAEAAIPGAVVVNVATQAPNSLLHDGQAWKRYRAERILEETRAALRRSARAAFLVHASYLFAGADEAGLTPGDSLRPIIDAALQAEELVLTGTTPACVVRLGYLYGPGSRNLRAYRIAFRLARPYWSGPGDVRQRFLHADDAASALLAAAQQQRAGRILTAADNQPVAFATFMDHFAKLVGNPLPLHLPAVIAPVSRLFIAREHMQMCELPTSRIAASARPLRFRPAYPSYRTGLRQVIDAWAA